MPAEISMEPADSAIVSASAKETLKNLPEIVSVGSLR